LDGEQLLRVIAGYGMTAFGKAAVRQNTDATNNGTFCSFQTTERYSKKLLLISAGLRQSMLECLKPAFSPLF
jgi:hypothetical protein